MSTRLYPLPDGDENETENWYPLGFWYGDRD